MTPRVDDLGSRQDELDQADVREVVRHLVDEERRVGLALDARVRDVLITQRAPADQEDSSASTSRYFEASPRARPPPAIAPCR